MFYCCFVLLKRKRQNQLEDQTLAKDPEWKEKTEKRVADSVIWQTTPSF